MKTNEEKLVMQSMQGAVHHPTASGDGYWVGFDGKGRIPLGVGGITYNFKLGDSCMNLVGDHIEPGVSIKNSDGKENCALMAFSCIGNEATIISGDAKGCKGFVSGKHGGSNHVIAYFDADVLEKLNINDRISIKACGQGLKLLDYPDITVMNIDPALLQKLNIIENDAQSLTIGVTHIIPAHLMGSGLGETTLMTGDYDIMTQDPKSNLKYHLDTLRFGDIVYIENHDCTNGAHYRSDSGSVGVIVHSDSYTSGHGPGVCVILTSRNAKLKPIIDPHANLADILLHN